MASAKTRILMAAAVLLLVSSSSWALILVGGADPIQHESEGWPKGTMAAANMSTRISWWEGPPFGGGEYHYQYVCEKTEQFNEMLEVFRDIEAEKLELVVHNGPQTGHFGGKKRYDWDMVVWDTDRFKMLHGTTRGFYRVGDDANEPVPAAKQEVPAPRIDVYIGGGGAIIWEMVTVPPGIKVIDRRPESVDKKYAGKGLVRAKVIDGKTSKPIVGAEIELFAGGGEDKEDVRILGKTDAKGECLISAVPKGLYDVTIVAKGYVSMTAGRYDNRRAELNDVNVQMLRPTSVSGRVVDVDGKGLADLVVKARDFARTDGRGYSCAEEKEATTDSQGRFEIKDVPPGFVTLRCWATGLYQTNHVHEMWAAPTDEVVLRLVGTATIRGEVIGEDGRRVTGRRTICELEDARGPRVGTWGSSGYIKEDGTFEINGVPPGEYVIWAKPNPSNSGYQAEKEELTVKPGKVYELTLTVRAE